jgi:hypothetical protein
MRWSKISPIGDRICASANCSRSARWHGEAGAVGSVYCSACREAIAAAEIEAAAHAVVAFDWSDNDADAVAAIERLRRAVIAIES